jgi:hypothetical protein
MVSEAPRPAVKKRLRDWLEKGDYAPIVASAGRNRRVLSYLTALTYDLQPLISWRAVEAMGLAAGHISDEDPEFVRAHLRRLMWLLSDESGSIGWHAPEMIGEILRSRPTRFAEFIPILISILDMEEEDVVRFRAGALWAIGRIAQVTPEAVQPATGRVLPLLEDQDPQIRGLAAWCLGHLATTAPLAAHAELLSDEGQVDFYADGRLVSTTVGRLALAGLATPAGD